MVKLERVVVGYDFSAEGEVALAQAIAVARGADAELVIAHVAPPAGAAGGELGERRRAFVRDLRDRLSAVRERASGRDVRVSQVVAEGAADEGLISIQSEMGAELLVVGSHGRSGVRWLALGSVAERAVRTSPRSVLVARGDRPARGGFRRVLVPTDFSGASIAALERALAVAEDGAVVEILHCWQIVLPGFLDWGGSAFEYAAVRDDVLTEAERRGRDLVRRFERDHPNLELALVEQPPRQGIHRRLETNGYDLVALGSRGHRGVKRWLLGSVAESITRHAPCSVLVTHADH